MWSLFAANEDVQVATNEMRREVAQYMDNSVILRKLLVVFLSFFHPNWKEHNFVVESIYLFLPSLEKEVSKWK